MYWPPPPYYGQPINYPPMNPQAPPPSGVNIKELRKAIKFYQTLLKEEEDKKNKGKDDKKKEDGRKPPMFSVLQLCMLLTGLGPLVGLFYIKMFYSLLSSIPH